MQQKFFGVLRQRQSKATIMLGRIILFFVLVPLIELVLLKQLLDHTNLLVTIGLVLVTGVVGANLARRQGMQVWRSIHEQTAQGQMPSKEILSGVMILIAGAFLITPGILTDACGFLLLIPRLRIKLGVFLAKWFKATTIARFQSGSGAWPPNGSGSGFADDSPPDEQPSVRVVEPSESIE